MELNLVISKLDLKEEFFDHSSQIHGINHTYRVMTHVLILGTALVDPISLKTTLAAAFIHDMSRKHDGYCTEHGAWAAEHKVPAFKTLFDEMKINGEERDFIRKAVTNHSQFNELDKHDPAWKITSVLKDADALDRFRIGANNLDKAFLRHPQTHDMIDFARDFYESTINLNFRSFTEVLEHAKTINHQNRLPWSNIL